MDKNIKLSNKGAIEMIHTNNYYSTFITANDDNKKLIFNFEKNNKILLKESDNSSFKKYISRLIQVASRNKIRDTDRVFFTKSSNFPRTSFNRYSDKAKLIQKVEKADKIVIFDKNLIKMNWKYIFKILNPLTKEFIYFNLDKYTLQYIINNLDSEGIELYQDTVASTYSNFKIKDDIKDDILSGINKATTIFKDVEVKDLKFHSNIIKYEVNTYSLKNIEALNLIMSGNIPISSFITDTEVNSYINKFKGEFDEGTYKFLKQTLSVERGNADIPLQLLCNLNIKKNDPRLYALFLNLNKKEFYNMYNSKALLSIDMKNLIKEYNLTNYINYYLQGTSYFNSIFFIFNLVKNKKYFYSLIKDKFIKNFADINNYNEDKINIDYEEISS